MALLRTIAAVTTAFGVAVSAGGAGAQEIVQATCDWYANTALQQQKSNVDRKCGFKGESWSFDRGSHMAWCQSVGPDQWRRQAQFRDQELARCTAGGRR